LQGSDGRVELEEEPPMLSPCRILLASLAALLVCVPAPAQQAAEADLAGHLEWIQAGKREDIPWRVRIHGPELQFNQRLGVDIEVSIQGSDLNRHGDQHDLLLVARVADSDGAWLDEYRLYRGRLEQRLPRRSRAVFRIQAAFRPGRYTLAVVMVDRLSGARNVYRERFEVRPLRNDPLPDSWQTVAPVEFYGTGSPIGANLLPSPAARLSLPVANRQPVRVEVLAVVTPSDEYGGPIRTHRATLNRVLPAVDVLSDIELRDGTLQLSALDLINRRVVYQQELTSAGVDWRRLHEALNQVNPAVVSADALGARQERGAWFRKLLAERLAAEDGSNAGSPPDTPTRRVFVIVGPSQLFPARSDLEEIVPPAECDCTVYHLEIRVDRGHLWDQLGRILRPLRPQRRVIEQPMDLRRAIAEILEDLRTM
jgi:hypothetical protein